MKIIDSSAALPNSLDPFTFGIVMTRSEFETLRALPNKRIVADIIFTSSSNSKPNLTFENVAVENEMGYDVRINGTYQPEIPTLTLNFVVREAGGPVCRFCVNSNPHKDAGRHHKHEMRNERDPARNLPSAHDRADLKEKTPSEIWAMVLRQSNIEHTGRFYDPS